MLQPALSTMWMMNRHKSLPEFFEAAQQAGFERFELNHFVSQEMVNGVKFPAEAILSLHAPCPTHPRTRDAEVSALDKEERMAAVEAVAASIALAERIGARVVILHAGHVEVNPELEKALRALYNQGQRGSARYRDLQAELIAERARHAERHLDATLHALERIATLADHAGIRIALENRFFYNEIPLPEELAILLDEFAGPVGFWYDTGHAYTLEELGFIPHREWLSGFGAQLLGLHLHDVKTVPQTLPASSRAMLEVPEAEDMEEEEAEARAEEARAPHAEAALRDHQMPGSGIVDFREVVPYLRDEVLVTAEIDWHHTAEQVRATLDYLRGLKGAD
ncbi:MAG: sugar phosphate isomerase/epimerase [Anaerolineae bacterium]|nr:sugar phosphate isomerase/epimerase [Anaerolineae bacterium]MDW8071304.1 TIM barrel protein [Anaerolineae bacterium]